MQSREQETASMEAAALQRETAELLAEQRFDDVYHAAEQNGTVATVTESAEFREWMTARAETDAAWGRWALSKEIA